MARKSKQSELREANLTLAQMQASIPMIDRRLADLESFDPLTVNDRSDAKIKALSGKLDDLLVSIFGAGTVEYERYHWNVTNLDTAGINMYGTPIEEVREGLLLRLRWSPVRAAESGGIYPNGTGTGLEAHSHDLASSRPRRTTRR
jgi:hypothetical protein